jgi:hypothetical protein
MMVQLHTQEAFHSKSTAWRYAVTTCSRLLLWYVLHIRAAYDTSSSTWIAYLLVYCMLRCVLLHSIHKTVKESQYRGYQMSK